jgi:hypothetical protein
LVITVDFEFDQVLGLSGIKELNLKLLPVFKIDLGFSVATVDFLPVLLDGDPRLGIPRTHRHIE